MSFDSERKLSHDAHYYHSVIWIGHREARFTFQPMNVEALDDAACMTKDPLAIEMSTASLSLRRSAG
jgi:hypothetical protein